MNRIILLIIFSIICLSCKKNKYLIAERNNNESSEKASRKTNPSEKKIKELFEKINIHESKNNGVELYKLSDRKTKSYFKKILKASLDMDSTEVSRQGIFDKMMILLIRGKYNPNKLKELGGKGVFIEHYNQLKVIPSMVRDRILLNIKINGDNANAELNSKTFRYSQIKIVKFVSNNNQWKYDFTSFYDINTKMMDDMLNESDETEDQYLSFIMRASGVKKSYEEIWHPLN